MPADNAQCPSCGKHYPDFVKREPLYQLKPGVVTPGSAWAYPVTGSILLWIAAGVGFLNHLVAFLPQWSATTLLILVGLGLVGVFLSVAALIWLNKHPRAGYRYRCKHCGKCWDATPARAAGARR